jgi:acetyltransferase-like isoleucine patch superfamily enzyme
MKYVILRFLDWLLRHLQWYREQQLNKELMANIGSCGKNVYIRGMSKFIDPSKLNIGNNVWIGENAWFRCDGEITIGNNVIISRRCSIFSANHQYEGETLPYDESFRYRPVVIEDNVWIGMNVSIAAGVTIGEGAIISMGSVVTKDVDPLSIVGGTGVRVINKRDREHYENLKMANKFLIRDSNENKTVRNGRR